MLPEMSDIDKRFVKHFFCKYAYTIYSNYEILVEIFAFTIKSGW